MWAPESGEDREKEGEATGPGGVPKPKQWPKIITRRRIPAQKKEDKLCVARGSRRYLESAGGGRPSDYSLRGAPHPRAAERIFPWGGVSESGEGLLTALLLGDPSCPAHGTRAGPRLLSHGAHFSPLAHARTPSRGPRAPPQNPGSDPLEGDS